MIKITLKDRLGRPLASMETVTETLTFSHPKAYGFEDSIELRVRPESHILIDIDPHIIPSIVYTPSGLIHYVIPAGWKTKAYHEDAFKGSSITLKASYVSPDLLKSRRNLALNGLDLRWETGYYPHAEANVVTRDEPWFEAKNAIDGHLTRDGHGAYPYQSWGGGLRDDLEFYLYFGREVLVDEIILYQRADFTNNHDIHWESGILEFSNGQEMTLHMKGQGEADRIAFPPMKIEWLKLRSLKRDLSEAFSALTQIEVYGREI